MSKKCQKIELTQEYVRSVLDYDELTGIFTWRHSGKGRKLGRMAGSLHRTLGSVQLHVGGKLYYAHRVAWLYMTGAWPKEHIDHIDGNPANNAWANLRAATNSENMQNQRRSRSDNKSSGLLGVTWSKPARRWIAQIQIDGVHKYLGLHDTPELAHAAYIEAKRVMHPFGNI